jgi:hypothetical protein
MPPECNHIEVEIYGRNVIISDYLLLTVQRVGPNTGWFVCYTEQKITLNYFDFHRI